MAKGFRFLFTLILACFASQSANAEPFTAELLVRLDRVGAPSVSPDGSLVAYAVRKTDMDAAKGRYDLWISELPAENRSNSRDTNLLTVTRRGLQMGKQSTFYLHVRDLPRSGA